MEDKQIVDLYFERSESAITETEKKYGRYCHYIAYRILENDEDAKEMDIFYSYMRGGIELLYERLVLGHGNNDTEDYGNSDINHLIALIKTPFNEADEFGKVED